MSDPDVCDVRPDPVACIDPIPQNFKHPQVSLEEGATMRALTQAPSIKRYCDEVGIDQAVSVHSLRVTAATEALPTWFVTDNARMAISEAA